MHVLRVFNFECLSSEFVVYKKEYVIYQTVPIFRRFFMPVCDFYLIFRKIFQTSRENKNFGSIILERLEYPFLKVAIYFDIIQSCNVIIVQEKSLYRLDSQQKVD